MTKIEKALEKTSKQLLVFTALSNEILRKLKVRLEILRYQTIKNNSTRANCAIEEE